MTDRGADDRAPQATDSTAAVVDPEADDTTAAVVDPDADDTTAAVVDPDADDATDPRADDPTDDGGVARTAVHALVAVGVTVLAIVASAIGGAPAIVIGTDSPTGFVVGLLGSELGFVAVAVGFVLLTGRGLGYFDLRLPGGAREWAFVVGFTVALFLARSVLLVGALELGIQPAPSTVGDVDLPPRVLAGILIPAMLLVVGPAEELLFRGVVQTFLRETLSAWPAILGAGALFGVIHVFALVRSSGAGTLLSIVVITAVGVALGWLYERTGSLPAAMVAHGGYNALIVVSAFALQGP